MRFFNKIVTIFLISGFVFSENTFATQNVVASTPKIYTIKTRDLPPDIKACVKLFCSKKKEIQASPDDLRKALTILAAVEKKMPGFTKKALKFAQSQGYNEGSGNMSFKSSDISDFLSEFLCDIPFADMIKAEMATVIPDFGTKNTAYPVPQALITDFLGKMQLIEALSKGITKRARNFLKSKYGFRG